MATDPGIRRLALGTQLAAFAGTAAPDWASRLLSEGLAGYTLFGFNIAEPVQLSSLTATLRAARPDVLIAVDEEGGDVTRLAHATGSPYPGNAALGAGQRTAGEQQLQRRAVVQRAKQPGCARESGGGHSGSHTVKDCFLLH